MINAVGLANKGVDAFLEDLPGLSFVPVPVIVSVGGAHARRLRRGRAPHSRRASPQRRPGRPVPVCRRSPATSSTSRAPTSRPASRIGADAAATGELTARVRALTRRLLIVKLTPNVTDVVAVAVAAAGAGADVLVTGEHTQGAGPRASEPEALPGQPDRWTVRSRHQTGRPAHGLRRWRRRSTRRSSAWAASRAARTRSSSSPAAPPPSPSGAANFPVPSARTHPGRAAAGAGRARPGKPGRRARRGPAGALKPAVFRKIAASGRVFTVFTGLNPPSRFAYTGARCPPQTKQINAAPERSLAQRMDALQRANHVRSRGRRSRPTSSTAPSPSTRSCATRPSSC